MDMFSIAGRIAIEGAEQATKVLQSVSESGKNVASNLSNSAEVMTKSSNTVLKWATGIGAGLAIYAKGALEMAGDYERTMNMVSHISGANAEEQKQLDAQAKEIASNTKFNANNIAEGYLAMSRAGLTATEQLGLMNGASSFAIITNKDLGDSVDDLIKVNSMFGLGIEDTSHVMDVMTSSADKSTMTVDDMMQGLKYCGSTASLFGNTIDMTAGTLAMLAKHGIDGTKAGTGLTQMFTELVSPSGEARKVMEAYNLELYNSDGSMKNLGQIADMLKGAFSGLSEEERNSALTSLFGAQSMKIATAMMEEGADGIEKYSYTIDDLNYAQETANVLTQGWKGATERLTSTLETLQLTIGQKLQPLMEPLVDKISEILDKFRSWIDNGGDLFGIIGDIAMAVGVICLPAIASLAGGFVALMIPLAPLIALGALIVGLFEAWKNSSGFLKVALGILLGVVTTFTVAFGLAIGIMSKMEAIKKAVDALKGLETIFGLLKTGASVLMGGLQSLWGVLMANPIILIVVAVIALVAGFVYLWNHCEGFRDFFINMWEKIKEVAKAFWDWLKEAPLKAWEAIKNVWNGVVDFFKGIFGKLESDNSETWQLIKEACRAVWDAIKAYIEAFVAFWKSVFEVVKAVWTTLWDAIKSIFTAIWGVLKAVYEGFINGFKIAWEAIKAIWLALWDYIKSIFTAVWDVLKAVYDGFIKQFKLAWGAVKQIWNALWTAIKSFFSAIWDTIVSIFKGVLKIIIGIITGDFGKVRDGIQTIFNGIKDFFVKIWDIIKTLFSTVLSAIWNYIKGSFENVKSTIINVWEAIKNFFKTWWDALKTLFVTVLGAIKDFIVNTFNNVKTTISTIFNAIKTVISTAWNAILSIITTIVNGIKSAITNAWNGILSTTTNIFNNIRSTMSNILEGAFSAVSGIINRIKGLFNFSWELPKLKLPHFSVSGSFSLNPPKVPSFGIDWYADGGIMTDPTIFGFDGNNAMVGGEAGAEAIIPLKSDVLAGIGKGIADQMDMTELVSIMKEMKDEIKELREDNKNLKVVLNSGALVGEITPEIDRTLKRNSDLSRRGVNV